MPAKVVDASAMAAWCFREPRASEAALLLKGSELHAPILLAYELTSTARRKVMVHPERAPVIGKALQIALSLPIRWSDVDHLAVWRLALDANLTTYDACYLYLARTLGASLVTFDEQLLRAARAG